MSETQAIPPQGGLSVTEYAARSGVSPRTVRRWVALGYLRAVRFGSPRSPWRILSETPRYLSLHYFQGRDPRQPAAPATPVYPGALPSVSSSAAGPQPAAPALLLPRQQPTPPEPRYEPLPDDLSELSRQADHFDEPPRRPETEFWTRTLSPAEEAALDRLRRREGW